MDYFITLLLEVFIVTLCILAFIVLRSTLSNDVPYQDEHLNAKTLKTGDIVLVGYTHAFGHFVRMWTQSLWIHAGIVLVEDGQVYILEAANYDKTYKGLLKMTLRNWLKFNKKAYLSVLRLKEGKIDPQQLEETFFSFKDKKLESFSYSWARFLVNRKYNEDEYKKEKFVCYEMVMATLMKMDIVEKDKSFTSYLPCNIAHREFRTCKGYKYSPMVGLDPKPYLDSCLWERYYMPQEKKSKLGC